MIVINLRYVFSFLLLLVSGFLFYNGYCSYIESETAPDIMKSFLFFGAVFNYILAFPCLILGLYFSNFFKFINKVIKFKF